MKKILNFLGIITLIGTSITSLAACNTSKYTEEKLAELKKENKIKINNQEIRDNLEGMTSQEKPFNKADNRGYFIIGKAYKGIITKYKNNRYEPDIGGIIEELNNSGNRYRLMIRPKTDFGAFSNGRGRQGKENNISYFKGVYRGNLDNNVPDLIIDNDNNVKIKEKINIKRSHKRSRPIKI